MKKFILAVSVVFFSIQAQAAIRCAPTIGGGMCCWDTATEGPFKPVNCM